MKGITVWVLATTYQGKFPTDSTNGGVSSKHSRLTLIGEDIRRPDKTASKEMPAIYLVKGNLLGATFLKAVVPDKNGVSPMFGGNYITSSEARFPAQYPIPIYDRFE